MEEPQSGQGISIRRTYAPQRPKMCPSHIGGIPLPLVALSLAPRRGGDLSALRSAISPTARSGDLPALSCSHIPSSSPEGPCKREKAADGPSGHPGCSRLQPLRKQAFDGPETKTAGRFRDQLPFPFAEEGGFEPPIPREGYTGFRDQRLQPLGHPSLGIAKIYKKNKLTKRQRVL